MFDAWAKEIRQGLIRRGVVAQSDIGTFYVRHVPGHVTVVFLPVQSLLELISGDQIGDSDLRGELARSLLDGMVVLDGVGRLKLHTRKSRVGVDPSTGEPITHPPVHSVRLLPDREFRERGLAHFVDSYGTGPLKADSPGFRFLELDFDGLTTAQVASLCTEWTEVLAHRLDRVLVQGGYAGIERLESSNPRSILAALRELGEVAARDAGLELLVATATSAMRQLAGGTDPDALRGVADAACLAESVDGQGTALLSTACRIDQLAQIRHLAN